MPAFLVSLLISLAMKLFLNEEFLEKITLIVLYKLRETCQSRGRPVLVIAISSIIEWLESDDGIKAMNTTASSIQAGDGQEELVTCLRERFKRRFRRG